MNKKEKALLTLASCSSYAEAARVLEVDPSTIYEWLKDKKFAERLERLRSSIFTEAINKLKGHSAKAVDTLADLLIDENSQVRRGAANDILNHATKLKEVQETEARLKALEKAQQAKEQV